METETRETGNKYGLSRKTNIGMAAMAALSASQDSGWAVLAIAVIACLGIVVQGIIDLRRIEAGRCGGPPSD